jgi:anti-anti-sigma regulatory factor
MGNSGVRDRRMGSVTILDADSNLRFARTFGASRMSLLKATQSLLEEGRIQILLNLGGVVGFDANSLGQVVSAQVSLIQKGGQLKLVRLSPQARELMTTAKMLAAFEVYEDESKAVAAFASDVLVESACQS